jgi:hypothetical protein
VQFQDELAGGVVLVRPALQSPDYVAGASGWAVKVDGSAEFNDITIRGGTVVSGTALYYDGAPAAGSLFVAIAAAAGADEYGNAYGAGLTVGPPAARQVQLVQDATGGYVSLRHNDPDEEATGFVSTQGLSSGATRRLLTQVVSPRQTGGGAMAVQMISSSLDGTVPAQFAVVTDDGGVPDAVLRADRRWIQIAPETPSELPVLLIEAPDGHPGRLIEVASDGVGRFAIEADGTTAIGGDTTINGDTAIAGAVTAANIQSGTFQITPTVANEWTANVAVNFPTPFATTPVVVLCCTGMGPGTGTTTELEWCLTGTTTGGFNARIRRGNLTQTTLSWLAVST